MIYRFVQIPLALHPHGRKDLGDRIVIEITNAGTAAGGRWKIAPVLPVIDLGRSLDRALIIQRP